jgi:hypothetical protein
LRYQVSETLLFRRELNLRHRGALAILIQTNLVRGSWGGSAATNRVISRVVCVRF